MNAPLRLEMFMTRRLRLCGGRGLTGNLCTFLSIFLWTWNCSLKIVLITKNKQTFIGDLRSKNKQLVQNLRESDSRERGHTNTWGRCNRTFRRPQLGQLKNWWRLCVSWWNSVKLLGCCRNWGRNLLVQNLRSFLGKSEIGAHTWRASRDQRRKQTPPDW